MPPVCLPVGDLEMAHCCMPYALSHSGQNSKPHNWRRMSKKYERCIWAAVNKMVSHFMSERKAAVKGAWKPTVAFLQRSSFLLWSIFICSPFGKLRKRFDNRRHVFFMWESASVIQGEKCYFSPPTVVYGMQVSKSSSVSKVKIDKSSNMRSACSYFRSVGTAWEFRICLCDSGSQLLSALKCECAKCMRRSTPESRRVFSAEFACYEITSAQWGARCTA